MPCSEIPQNVIWHRGRGPAQRRASLLVCSTESQWSEWSQDGCLLPPSLSKREQRIKELLAKAGLRLPGSLNTCTVAWEREREREASASLEINYQGPFNELLASRAHLMSCLHLISIPIDMRLVLLVSLGPRNWIWAGESKFPDPRPKDGVSPLLPLAPPQGQRLLSVSKIPPLPFIPLGLKTIFDILSCSFSFPPLIRFLVNLRKDCMPALTRQTIQKHLKESIISSLTPSNFFSNPWEWQQWLLFLCLVTILFKVQNTCTNMYAHL